MTFNTDQFDKQGEKIDCKEVVNFLNNLTTLEQGLLFDCVVPGIRNEDYPCGISKPIPFLRAVSYQEKLMLIIVEYQLYLDQSDQGQELALEIPHNELEIYKTEDSLNLFTKAGEQLQIKLHSTFDFAYQLETDISLPIYPLLDWLASPFI
ncbi:hypothetical protein MWH25_11180 [Natroniella acetigena]|uniref:hypothetical protein n=1 Tax=Natroniella acetigena TaxID=52004 RepID=UPI00200B7234|nr:hypothetical protein [Natroniella acetigena]MCK8828295.1 hypothetical protein [Natroniella acetigena]